MWSAVVSGYSGPPMDLNNMRANGVRSLAVHCLDCTHGAEVNVDAQPDHLEVPLFAKRLRCSKCGSKNVHVMPAWSVKRGRIPGG